MERKPRKPTKDYSLNNSSCLDSNDRFLSRAVHSFTKKIVHHFYTLLNRALIKTRRQWLREYRQTKGLMSKTMGLHVHVNFIQQRKALAKRSQHLNTTYCNILGRNMLHAFGHPAGTCSRDVLRHVGY